MYNIKEIKNKIICGDCLKALKKIPSESIDLVITSPPYNIGIDYGIYKDDLDWIDYLKWSSKWIKEIHRVLKNSGRFVLNILTNINQNFIKEQPLIDFGNLIRKTELKIHGIGFWIDVTRKKYTAWGSWQSASAPYIYNPYEAIIFSYKKEWKKKIKGVNTLTKEQFLKGIKGVYNFGTASHKIIPAIFPIKLPLLFIELLTFKNDIVLDPFIGSGTTGLACKKLERNFIGIEKNPLYTKIAKERIERGS